MDDNLPPTNDNQQPENPNINPPEPPVVPPTSNPIATEEISLPEVEIPKAPEPPTNPPMETEKNTVPPKPEAEPEEAPIEIGSLGQPAFTSYSQETAEKTQDDSPKTAKPKAKKIKTMASVLGILLIALSLPLSLLLVKQNQEIRKEAETPGLSGSVSLCGITVSPVSQSFENGVYTFTYKIAGSGQKVNFHAYACSCTDGTRGSCGTNSAEKCNSENETLTAPFTRSIQAPKIGDCGTYQGDVFILSVNGDTGCYTNK